MQLLIMKHSLLVGVGECHFLEVLNITFKYMLKLYPILVRWCEKQFILFSITYYIVGNIGILVGKCCSNLCFHLYVVSTIIWLVVWNMFYVSIYWECHHPNWRTHIFQRGRYTTNQYIIGIIGIVLLLLHVPLLQWTIITTISLYNYIPLCYFYHENMS